MASKKLHCTQVEFRGRSIFQSSQIYVLERGNRCRVFIDAVSFPLGLPACLPAPILVLRGCLFSLSPGSSHTWVIPLEYTTFKVIIAKEKCQ